MAELAEIDKQSAIVAMEAKIDKLAEMVEAKTQRLSMVSEDENLSELIDKIYNNTNIHSCGLFDVCLFYSSISRVFI